MLENKEQLLSDVLCWIFPKHNALFSGLKVLFFLHYYFSALLQTGCMFWNIVYSVLAIHSVIYVKIVE